jgi:hypothetical protein
VVWRVEFSDPHTIQNSTPGQKFHFVSLRIAKSWSSICTAAPHWWHFVDPHNDAAILVQRMLFSFGSCDHSPRYSADEFCTEIWKEMAVYINSIMVGLLQAEFLHPPRGEFCAPHLMTKFLCKQFSFHLSHACSPSQRYYRQGLYGKVRENGRMRQQRHVWPTAS